MSLQCRKSLSLLSSGTDSDSTNGAHCRRREAPRLRSTGSSYNTPYRVNCNIMFVVAVEVGHYLGPTGSIKSNGSSWIQGPVRMTIAGGVPARAKESSVEARTPVAA